MAEITRQRGRRPTRGPGSPRPTRAAATCRGPGPSWPPPRRRPSGPARRSAWPAVDYGAGRPGQASTATGPRRAGWPRAALALSESDRRAARRSSIAMVQAVPGHAWTPTTAIPTRRRARLRAALALPMADRDMPVMGAGRAGARRASTLLRAGGSEHRRPGCSAPPSPCAAPRTAAAPEVDRSCAERAHRGASADGRPRAARTQDGAALPRERAHGPAAAATPPDVVTPVRSAAVGPRPPAGRRPPGCTRRASSRPADRAGDRAADQQTADRVGQVA